MNLSITPNPNVTFTVLHQDDDLLVVQTPPYLVTQPGKGHESDTLLNGLFARFGPQLQNLGARRDFGLLHRLDKEASGVLIVALRPVAYDSLREAFAKRKVKKFYWAVTHKAPNKPTGTIRRPILEETGQMKTARLSPAGKPSLTAYRVLQTTPLAALLECRPVTGRLHQVRLHLSSIGCSILGDDLYGSTAVAKAATRVALHAHRIVFTHPTTGDPIDARSPWPKDLGPLLRRLGLANPARLPPDRAGT